jgi:NTE family protein
MKQVGLALSGGAVRGFAHAGVLRVLEQHDIPIHCVAGTSAGSLAGAFLAAGFSAEHIIDVARRVDRSKVAGLTISNKGILDGDVLEQFIIDEIGDINIEDLKIPFAAVAVDLTTGELAVFDRGPLAPAVRASCAIPGVFTPLERDDHVYVDGGVLSFDPVPQTRALGAEYVIEVTLVPPRQPKRRPNGIREMLLATFELNMLHVTHLEPSGEATIRPDLSGTDMYDFRQRELLMKRGEEAALTQIDQIKEDLEGTRSLFPWRR